jgi:hypothetical protein
MIREMDSVMQHELGPKSFGREMDEAIGFSCKGEDRKRKSGCETEFDSWVWVGLRFQRGAFWACG